MAGSEHLLLLGTVSVQGNVQEDGREGTDWKRPTFGGRWEDGAGDDFRVCPAAQPRLRTRPRLHELLGQPDQTVP